MRFRIVAAATAIAAMLVPSAATEAQAAPMVRFSRVQYNSPGADNRTNDSLNQEYVRVTNYSRTTTYRLTNWTIRDRENHVYKLPTLALRPGKSVTLHTGRGTNTATDLYWNSRAYIWNNTGEIAYLRTASGSLDDTCSWGNGSGFTAC